MKKKSKTAKRAAPKKKAAAQRPSRAKRPAKRAAWLEFNHAMVYSVDVARSVAFYRDLLGFEVIDQYPGAYARLRSPGTTTTLALHCVEDGRALDPRASGLRLYFEVKALDRFCAALAAKGVLLDQMPKDMPWGWRHAYLRDPDGHEISLYWAGRKRLATGLRG